jgi:RNA polymerase sigma factor (TIGR02999 family)
MTRVVPLIYDQLRQIADREMRRELGPRTLQATALVHEAFLRLQEVLGQHWTSRSHFFAFSAHLIRRILVDAGRERNRLKRGQGLARATLAEAEELALERSPGLVALDDALNSLEAADPFKAAIVELRFFGGLTREEAATALGVSPETVGRHWRQAKAWLYHELSQEAAP